MRGSECGCSVGMRRGRRQRRQWQRAGAQSCRDHLHWGHWERSDLRRHHGKTAANVLLSLRSLHHGRRCLRSTTGSNPETRMVRL